MPPAGAVQRRRVPPATADALTGAPQGAGAQSLRKNLRAVKIHRSS